MWFEVLIFLKSIETIYCFNVSFWASSKLILTFTKWGGVACETTSVYGQQLLSTSASPHAYVRTICFQHEWAKNVSNHCKTNTGYDSKFTKFSVDDFFLIDRRNLVRYASKNAKKISLSAARNATGIKATEDVTSGFSFRILVFFTF